MVCFGIHFCSFSFNHFKKYEYENYQEFNYIKKKGHRGNTERNKDTPEQIKLMYNRQHFKEY